MKILPTCLTASNVGTSVKISSAQYCQLNEVWERCGQVMLFFITSAVIGLPIPI